MIDFVLAGTFKAASSTLGYELAKHPEIFVPTPKDPHYFVAELFQTLTGPADFLRHQHEFGVYNRAAFEELYADAECALKGDTTPLYLYCYEHAIPAIQAENMSMPIIIILRDPVDRAYSNYNHNVKDGFEPRSFSECIETWEKTECLPLHPFFHYVRAGFYSAQVSAYLNAFKNVLIINYDDIINSPQGVLNTTCQFLGITSIIEKNEFIRLNKTGRPRVNFLNDFLTRESMLKKVMRPIYRRLITNRELRTHVSERIVNLNIKSLKVDRTSRAILNKVYRADIEKLSQQPGCEFARSWIL